jgi:exopolysaccharide biosynthesis polyprenyl glycosylphosphotransferase
VDVEAIQGVLLPERIAKTEEGLTARGTVADGRARSLAAASSMPDRDVRRKRPPALSFLLRVETWRRVVRVGSLLALDYVSVYAAIFIALYIKYLTRGTTELQGAIDGANHYFPFVYLVTILLFARSSLYSDRTQRPGLSRIVACLFQVTLVALLFALASGEEFNSFYIFYGGLVVATVVVSFSRYLYERVTGWLLRAAGYRRRAVLVGSGHQIDAVAHALARQEPEPVEVVGYVSLTPRPDNGLRSLGSLEDLPATLGVRRVHEVIIADPDFPQDQAVELADRCHQRGVTVRVAPSTMGILVQRAEFVPGQSVPLFELRPPVFEGFDYLVKRSFDLVGASLLLLVLSPVMAFIAAAVALSSRGGILYRSVRPGIGGTPFACFKFRTMHSDAEQIQADLEESNEASGALFKIRDDPRLTPIGRLLRRFSLDELPQLVNVLRGEMSLVGPRPLPMRDFEKLEDWHKKRYLVLPGITGLWQVSGRAELDFDDLVRLDFVYLERWSVFLDLGILVKTIPAVISRRGAF